jgi:glycosyltransferase involved in cell wall biosynthesis
MEAGVLLTRDDVPAMCEVGGGATQIFPVGDPTALGSAVTRVLSDAGLREQIIVAGRIRAQDFSWPDSARTLWGMYAQFEQ